MKITEVKVWLVEGVKYNWTLIKVYTDTGHTGVGEATNWPGSPIIEAAARHVGERVIGVIALVLLWLLWRNLQKQIKKIDVPVDMEHVESAPFATPEDDARAAAEATRGASRASTDHTA